MSFSGLFRQAFYAMLPPWLTNGDGEKLLHVLHRMKDASLAVMRQGMTQRFPSFAGDDALDLIGKDRLIPRGRTEPREHYIERLKAWRYPRGHRTRGSAFALLEQVSEYFGGMFCASIDVRGNAFIRGADGFETAAHGTPADWDWDGDLTRWARFWLVLYPQPEHPEIKAWGTWAQFAATFPTWGDAKAAGATWGQQGITAGDAAAIRALLKPPAPWKPAGTRGEFLIVVLTGNIFTTPVDPSGQAWDTPAGRHAAPSVLRFWRLS